MAVKVGECRPSFLWVVAMTECAAVNFHDLLVALSLVCLFAVVTAFTVDLFIRYDPLGFILEMILALICALIGWVVDRWQKPASLSDSNRQDCREADQRTKPISDSADRRRP